MIIRLVPLAISLFALAAPSLLAQPQDLMDKFERRSFTSDSLTIAYRLFVPDTYDPVKEYPLVLTLHRNGLQGTDNEHIAGQRMAISWAEPEHQERWPAFVMAPQAPPGQNWWVWLDLENTGVLGPRPTTYTVLAALDSLAREFSIDPDRVYITGASMGAPGTWSLTTLEPDRFAAAIPVAGGYFPAYARQGYYDYTPIWLFHGEADSEAPVDASREMLAAFMDRGRDVLFTNCGFDPTDCDPISDHAFEQGMSEHADLVYTGYPDGPHTIGPIAFEDPRLRPWVFAQHRLVRDGIQISSPSESQTFSGTATVTWQVTDPSETGELWLSPDNGENWTLIDSAVANTGSVAFEAEAFEDTPAARVRLLFRDTEGFIHKRETSELFTIDNDGNGSPYARLARLPFVGYPTFEDGELVVDLLAADPERTELDLRALFSTDGGVTFGEIGSYSLPTADSRHSIVLNLADLPNTRNGVLAVQVSDGDATAHDQTLRFSKETTRLATTFVDHVEGEGVADIVVNWVAPEQLTGHRYRITFNDERPKATAYSVADLDTGELVLEHIQISDGVSEGPEFDGVRLIVSTPDRASVDLDSTGWQTGTSDLQVSISTRPLNTPEGPVTFLASPADYNMTLYDAVVDTSAAEYGFAAVPMRFIIENVEFGRVAILFIDLDEDGWPSGGDALAILENVSGKSEERHLMPAWLLRFSADESTVPPAPGDVFGLRTIKPARETDVFEFTAVVGLSNNIEVPNRIRALTNHPNPFHEKTTIGYELVEPANVSLQVFDVLGRVITRFDPGLMMAGRHTEDWNASSHGSRLPPGLYFYRLSAAGSDGSVATEVGKMTLVR